MQSSKQKMNLLGGRPKEDSTPQFFKEQFLHSLLHECGIIEASQTQFEQSVQLFGVVVECISGLKKKSGTSRFHTGV